MKREKQTLRRSAAAALCMVMLLAVFVPGSARADYGAVDYSRINFSTNGKVYPAWMEIGGMKFAGKLRCTNEFDKDDVNEAIRKVFEATGMNEDKLRDAQAKIDAAARDKQFTYEDAAHIAENIVRMLGAGEVLDNAKYMAETISKFLSMPLEADSSRTQLDLVVDAIAQAESMLTGKIKDWAFDEVFLELTMESYNNYMKQFDIDLGKVGVFNPVSMIIETAKVSYSEYKLDKERWARRVEGVKARNLLDAFYEAVNLTLENFSGYKGQWRLKIVSSKDRRFTFYGADGNLQRWSVVVDLVNITGNSASSPTGTYEGVAAVYVNHNMRPFDRQLWYQSHGEYPAGWLLKVIESGFYSVVMGGGTHISRKMIKNDFRISMGALDVITHLGPRSKGLPKRFSISAGSFETDEIKVTSDRWLTINTAIGIGESMDNLQGYAIVDVQMHAEGLPNGGEGINIILDKAEGDVGTIITGTMQSSQHNTHIDTIWDSNIWAPLDGGMCISIGG